jgi:hypothetical protein
LIEVIINNKTITRIGGLFKVGMQVINSRDMIEAQKEKEKWVNKELEKKKVISKEKAEWANLQAVYHFQKMVHHGRQTGDNGQWKFGKVAALFITHTLLSRCAPKEKVSDYKSMKKCIEWFGSLAGDITWIEEMKCFKICLADP